MESLRKVQRLEAKQYIDVKNYDASKKIRFEKKLNKIKTVLRKNIKDYCESTSIHGLKYVVNKNLYPIERLFFAISFVCVVFGTAFFVDKIYEKWNRTPMLVSINPKFTQTKNEPFPAVTICNLNQAYKAKAENFSVNSLNYTVIQMLCKREVNVTVAAEIKDWSNLKGFIFDISQPCSNMILQCQYGGRNFNCTEIFRPLITDNGLCCTFNMVDPKFMYRDSFKKSFLINNYQYPKGYQPVDWSVEVGYQSNLPEKFMPMKTVGIGESLGLNLVLDVESEEYYCSSSDSMGFKILLHNPLEVPNMREIGLLLPPGRETKVRIRVEKIESEKYVRYMSKKARKCLFQDEMRLELYKEYTQRNCAVECSAKALLANCGCLPYFKPMLYGNETICDINDSNCVESVRLEAMAIDKSGKGCATKCPPSCNDLSYFPTFYSAPLMHTGFQINNKVIKNISNDYVEKNIAIVKIYFKDTAYRSEKNVDFIGVTDFLSNIGGIIGLFFGFSFISLAELVFYVILRPLRKLIVNKTSQFTRTSKFRRIKSVRRLFKKQSIGVSQQNTIHTKNALNRGRPWKVNASREYLLRSEASQPNTNIAWRPGVDYTP